MIESHQYIYIYIYIYICVYDGVHDLLSLYETDLALLKACEIANGILSAFAADSAGELNIFRHNSHSLGVNSAQVSIFEKTD